ncbi:MAG: TonB-dependent receptor plug domain-containing protein [Candidatus Cryptobacteroides sp.]
MRKYLIVTVLIFTAARLAAQSPADSTYTLQVDTTGWFADRYDSLTTAVVSASVAGNYIPRGKDFKAEVITAAGLCKMACCNLAESFENSASVSVGYADAVTGARQIRLLGQSGIYTQMLDENRPVMRGISAPFALNYVPGQWLESIQVSKGVSSVINGVESMTGQINLEHRKPTDEKPLFLQASIMDNAKFDVNAVSSLQLDYEGRWNTAILAHIDGNFIPMDMNGDLFLDDPLSHQISLANRWLYYHPSGLQVRFGLSALSDSRQGGQHESFFGSAHTMSAMEPSGNLWQSNILTRTLDGYLKVGLPLDEDGSNSLALVADYNFQSMDSDFGFRTYNALQHSLFVNFLYQGEINEDNKYTFGLSNTLDSYNENTLLNLSDQISNTHTLLNTMGFFGEYTFHRGDAFSLIGGLRADWFNTAGVRLSPRLTLKYAPVEQLVLRGNAGRGLRYSTPLVDNIGVLSTGKTLDVVALMSHPLEDAWTFGASATWYLPFEGLKNAYLSFDYFRTDFVNQMTVDYDLTPGAIAFYNAAGSYTNNYQLDFSIEPIRRLVLTLTGRYTDAKINLQDRGLVEKPLNSRYKAVFNAQYATRMNRFIFDFTASLNGPCRVWDFMKAYGYENGYTQAYPLLYAQVTYRTKKFDYYIGVENITDYTQNSPIISAANTASSAFDASCVWGPLMGRRIYAGFRMTLWKTY